MCSFYCFNTQPPKGGWHGNRVNDMRAKVSTHSRLKAAGINVGNQRAGISVSTHSRLKAAGWHRYGQTDGRSVSTHSRLKAAGFRLRVNRHFPRVSTHSRLKAAGDEFVIFQFLYDVSTHSRLKAAGMNCGLRMKSLFCFNTQPPKGGWFCDPCLNRFRVSFQHTAA